VTSRFNISPAIRAVSRWVLGTAGILWVAMAASLCGCSPISPVNGWVMNESGKAYYKRGDYRAARGEFERALMDRPQSPDYAFNVAAAMDQQGDHLAAEKMYRHALTLDPGHQPAYHGMAAMMMEDGRTAEANDLINTWAATQPYSTEATTELGWLKSKQGDIDGADRELRKALRQNPRHARARSELARVHGKSGNRRDAAAEYARSLFMDPDQPDAQAELAALNSNVYGDPALQMAAAMPLYDPTLQANAYPAFTAPASRARMASSPASTSGWNVSPQQYSTPHGQSSIPLNEMNWAQLNSPQGLNVTAAQGMTYNPSVAQSNWSQSPPQMMNGMQSEPTRAYPDAVSYSSPQPYNTARPAQSFFQPQHSFNGAMPGEMTNSTLVPTPDMNSQMTTGYNDAPQWNAGQPIMAPTMIPGSNWSSPPSMNASFGSGIPAAQTSGVPVVPAF